MRRRRRTVRTPSCTVSDGSHAAEKCTTSWPRRASAAPSEGTNRSAPRRTSGQQNACVRAMRIAGQRRLRAVDAAITQAERPPRASVIVPARNAARTLARTLSAISGQELDGGYEVLVVDDGSTDATAAIAAGMPGVTLLQQAPVGPAPARNLGAEHA